MMKRNQEIAIGREPINITLKNTRKKSDLAADRQRKSLIRVVQQKQTVIHFRPNPPKILDH